MSGGVGPTFSDIRLPREEPEQSPASAVKGIKAVSYFGFSTLGRLNALSIAVVFAATGMVSLEDVAFSLLSLLYTFFIAKSIFPAAAAARGRSGAGEKSRAETALAAAGAALGLALPIAYVCEGMVEGDQKGVAAAAPHVFLLASRVFVEGLAGDRGFSPPVEAFVRVLFSVRLLFATSSWVREETGERAAAGLWSARRLYVGRGLAAANLVYWSLYLFGFLVPVCLPKAFKRYYGKGKE